MPDTVPGAEKHAGTASALDALAIRNRLEACCLIGNNIVCLDETCSTNTEAFRLAEAGASDGTVILAELQTAGKGRLGRKWESPRGVNIYCSVILRPLLASHEAPQLTFLSSVAVVRAIETVTGLQPSIKWPNDLLLNNRKVAGLLNEMSCDDGRIQFVILGAGVNINMGLEQFPGDLRTPATSLFLESGAQVSRELFAVCLLKELDREYKRFIEHGFDPVREEWATLCNACGRNLSVDSGNSSIYGTFDGIDHDGALLVRVLDGSVERVLSGDVTVI